MSLAEDLRGEILRWQGHFLALPRKTFDCDRIADQFQYAFRNVMLPGYGRRAVTERSGVAPSVGPTRSCTVPGRATIFEAAFEENPAASTQTFVSEGVKAHGNPEWRLRMAASCH
jgi:hypothetical protein